MDPYFRSNHGSNPSPHDDESPHSATSQYRPFPVTSGLDRLLQSPQDMMRYNKGVDRYSLPGKADDGKGYDGFQYGQAQASSSQAVPQAGQAAGTGKRGSKACVACEFNMLTSAYRRSQRQE